MKKLLSILFMAFAVLSFAQTADKPSFQAFTNDFIKLTDAEGGYHKFSLKVEMAPWAFQAIGEVHVVGGDASVLTDALYDGSVYAVAAYVPSVAGGTDGKEYQVGVFDVMLYLDDEKTQVRNVKVRLLPPANDDWAMGIFKDAMATGGSFGALWGGNYESEITKASAIPASKESLTPRKEKPKKEEPVEEEKPLTKKEKKKAVMAAEDSDEPVKKKKKAYKEDEDEDGSNLSVKEKRRRAMLKKKNQDDEEDEEEPVVKKKKKKKVEDDDEEEPVVKKKKKKKVEDDDEEEPVKKKKKKKVEDDDDDEPVKKKKKKKSYDDDDDEPVKKKKKKKKSYDDDED